MIASFNLKVRLLAQGFDFESMALNFKTHIKPLLSRTLHELFCFLSTCSSTTFLGPVIDLLTVEQPSVSLTKVRIVLDFTTNSFKFDAQPFHTLAAATIQQESLCLSYVLHLFTKPTKLRIRSCVDAFVNCDRSINLQTRHSEHRQDFLNRHSTNVLCIITIGTTPCSNKLGRLL